jgi:hypothetical protein
MLRALAIRGTVSSAEVVAVLLGSALAGAALGKWLNALFRRRRECAEARRLDAYADRRRAAFAQEREEERCLLAAHDADRHAGSGYRRGAGCTNCARGSHRGDAAGANRPRRVSRGRSS